MTRLIAPESITRKDPLFTLGRPIFVYHTLNVAISFRNKIDDLSNQTALIMFMRAKITSLVLCDQ